MNHYSKHLNKQVKIMKGDFKGWTGSIIDWNRHSEKFAVLIPDEDDPATERREVLVKVENLREMFITTKYIYKKLI